jgi:EAL domain-containing protein (putative c-di-GMP-specific phosphodiesterase class I)
MPITMAFQPIVDVETRSVFAQEALVRGAAGESAGHVLARVDDESRYAFDQKCRVTAIRLAADAGLASNGQKLSINFLPNAVYDPRACIRLTLATASQVGFPLDQIIFEFTEVEKINPEHLLNILVAYRAMNFLTAIDDFGAGYAGLELLSRFQPDIVKLDMNLIRAIDRDRAKQAIVRNALRMLGDLGIAAVCEGVETAGEWMTLQDLGVRYMQGYFFARPALASPVKPCWPAIEAPAASPIAAVA